MQESKHEVTKFVSCYTPSRESTDKVICTLSILKYTEAVLLPLALQEYKSE